MARAGVSKKIAERPPVAVQNVAEAPLLLTERSAALLLGVSVSFLRKSRCEGALRGRTEAPPFIRIRGRIYYKRADIEKWVTSLESRDVI